MTTITTIEQIKTAITKLSEEKFRELRAWYEALDAQQWDSELENDIAAGRLDDLADAAIHAFETGQTTEL